MSLFFVIFCKTGLAVTPVLPGDSLLFALGAFAAQGALNVEILLISLCIAAIDGDTVNYTIGHYIGPKVFHYDDSRFFKKEYLLRTHQFYEKHGGKMTCREYLKHAKLEYELFFDSFRSKNT